MSAEMRERAAVECERYADGYEMFAADAMGWPEEPPRWRDAEVARELAAAIRALPVADAWQEISTAPIDGTSVLLWFPRSCSRRGSGVEKCCHDQGMWVTDFGEEARLYWDDPTHWMPLPAPPQENADA